MAQRIMKLISNIKDPVLRIDIASSINFLADVYTSGRASREEVMQDLRELCYEVFKKAAPDQPDEVLKERAEREAEELLEAMRIVSFRRRLTSKYGFRGLSE